jgi:hypothetical protein
MNAFISFENAVEVLTAAYLASVFAMMAVSQFCLAAIETAEESSK